MPNLTHTDLRDPSPPVPGATERAAVAARAHQLGRRRRILQGAGALGMVAAVAVGVAALTAGGSSSGAGGQRIEAAASATTDAPVATTVSAPATTVPAPTPVPDTAATIETPPAVATAPATPAVATTFTVSGTASNIPAGATLTLTLSGSSGTFSAVADGAGNYSIAGVPAGTYDAQYYWEAGGAAQVGKLGGVTITSDFNFNFSLP